MTAFGPANLGVFVCSHVFTQERPILFVMHIDGDWQFLCGEVHEDGDEPRHVGVAHLVHRDPTLELIAHIPDGSSAERQSIEDMWVCKA